MNLEAFAAKRDERLTSADDELEPLVRKALEAWSPGVDWYADLVVAASVLWLEIFGEEAPNADPDLFMPRYHDMVGEALSHTTEPTKPPADDQVTRITRWLATATVNNATYLGNRAHGGSGMRWVTMRDDSVRETHRKANGQIADRDGTFDIGGFDLHYPGEPVGPPEIWINCRCVLAPARVEGALTVSTPIIAALTDEADIAVELPDDEDLPDTDEPEDDEELITEIPVHGVATIEGKPTGDGRSFDLGSVTWGDLPQPFGFEFETTHGGENSRVANIGRIDEFFKYENPEGYVEIRWRGAIMPDKEHASDAIEGIIDGSFGGLSIVADSMALNMEASVAAYDSAPEGTVPVQHFSEVRIRRHDLVMTPAFQEGYVALGLEFPDELSEEELASVRACGCNDTYEVVELEGDLLAEFAADADAEDGAYRTISADERKKMAENGQAMPDGSFPIANAEDLRNAIQAIGRASDPEAAKRHIRKRAKALGEEGAIPEGWSLQWEAAENVLSVTDPEGMVASATFAPGTKDGPGWITHPIPTGRIRRYWVRGKGAAKIRWGVPGDFNRCRRQLAKYIANPNWLAGACANMHKEAIGLWPGQEGGRNVHSTGASMSLTAAATLSVKPADAFRDPGFTRPTPITIEGDRFFGHLAAWGVCHIGIQDVCTVAPHSSTNYAGFRTGHVLTDEGRIAVGNITMGTGHASIKANAKAAVAHYDNTGSVVADVVAGEDAFGIWVAGLLRPTITQEQVDALQASALSGDWRWSPNGLELVAALAVNVPGFPIPQIGLAASAEMGQESLVAAGIVTNEEEPIVAGIMPNPEEIAGIVRTAIEEFRFQEKREERVAALRPFVEKARAASISKLQSHFVRD